MHFTINGILFFTGNEFSLLREHELMLYKIDNILAFMKYVFHALLIKNKKYTFKHRPLMKITHILSHKASVRCGLCGQVDVSGMIGEVGTQS